jgi:hypothetical protein
MLTLYTWQYSGLRKLCLIIVKISGFRNFRLCSENCCWLFGNLRLFSNNYRWLLNIVAYLLKSKKCAARETTVASKRLRPYSFLRNGLVNTFPRKQIMWQRSLLGELAETNTFQRKQLAYENVRCVLRGPHWAFIKKRIGAIECS